MQAGKGSYACLPECGISIGQPLNADLLPVSSEIAQDIRALKWKSHKETHIG